MTALPPRPTNARKARKGLTSARPAPFTRRAALLAIAAAAVAPQGAAARPISYRLDPKASRVSFGFSINGLPQTGTMPIDRARIVIDPASLARSSVDVTVSVARAHTGLFLATEAMKSPEVLDAARHPEIRFVSTSIRLARDGRLSGGARITGWLSMRGITRKVTLDANLYRAPGSTADDLSRLNVRLTGAISRAAFGIGGYAGLVDDRVNLDITAVIDAGG